MIDAVETALMLKIGIHSDKPDSVRDFYRAMGVFSRLKDFQIVRFNLESLLVFENFDIIFLSSPVHPQNLNIIQYAKDHKIKIWSDFDDFIADVQTDNVAYDHGSNPNNIRNMFAAIRESDVVTVTTEFLKDELSQHNKNVHVIPNAFNDFVFKIEYNLSKNDIVGWRGAIDGHGRDLHTFVQQYIDLDSIFDENGWTFSFHGKNPWYLTDFIQNWSRTPEMPFFPFMEDFKKTNPAIFGYPLIDCGFNRSKSFLAWLDATYAGAACVMPDFEVYEDIPCERYSSLSEFKEKILYLIGSPEKRKDHYENSVQLITEKYLLSKVNKQREVVALDLC